MIRVNDKMITSKGNANVTTILVPFFLFCLPFSCSNFAMALVRTQIFSAPTQRQTDGQYERREHVHDAVLLQMQ